MAEQCQRSELDIFGKEFYDVSVLSTQKYEVYTSNPLSDASSPLLFEIKTGANIYTNLQESYFSGRFKIVGPGGVVVAATIAVAPINNILHSIFKSCRIFINGTPITTANDNYAIRSIIERELLFSKEYNKTQSSLAGYFKETDPASTDITDENTDSYKKRFEMSKGSRVFEAIGRPHADIFAQGNYLPPGCDILIEFIRSTDNFCLHIPAPTNVATPPVQYQLQILEAKLIIIRHKILPSIALRHLKLWENNQVANYSMGRVEVKSFSMPIGTIATNRENVITGQLLSRIVIGLANTADSIGDITTNPFIFNNFGLMHINVSVHGDESEKYALNLDF